MTPEIWATLSYQQKSCWNNRIKSANKANRSAKREAHDWAKAIISVADMPIGKKVHWQMSQKDWNQTVEIQILRIPGIKAGDYNTYTLAIGDKVLVIRRISQMGKGQFEVEVATTAILTKRAYDSEHVEFTHTFEDICVPTLNKLSVWAQGVAV
jgi:hypothetical protein